VGVSERDDIDLLMDFWSARGTKRDELRFPAWLALWRRIASDYAIDVIFHAATGKTLRHNGPYPATTDDFKRECRVLLRNAGLEIPEP
jgi:hypothetical protein